MKRITTILYTVIQQLKHAHTQKKKRKLQLAHQKKKESVYRESQHGLVQVFTIDKFNNSRSSFSRTTKVY